MFYNEYKWLYDERRPQVGKDKSIVIPKHTVVFAVQIRQSWFWSERVNSLEFVENLVIQSKTRLALSTCSTWDMVVRGARLDESRLLWMGLLIVFALLTGIRIPKQAYRLSANDARPTSSLNQTTNSPKSKQKRTIFRISVLCWRLRGSSGNNERFHQKRIFSWN